MPNFAELWNSGQDLDNTDQSKTWVRRTDYSSMRAPSAFQQEQLRYAERAGTSLGKLKALGLDQFVESTTPPEPIEPASDKGNDNDLTTDQDELQDYIRRITEAGIAGAGLSKSDDSGPDGLADSDEEEEELDLGEEA